MTDNGSQIIEKSIFPEQTDEPLGGMPFIAWVSAAGDLVPAWWSQARDIELRRWFKKSDHVSGTVNTLRDMMTAIPFKVVARNQAIKSHTQQARLFTDLLKKQTVSRSNLVSSGWTSSYGAFIDDFHTQDNGAFFVIDDSGKGNEPVQDIQRRLIHLDSARCWRTQSPEFPMIYTDLDGQQYKFHRSRVVNITSSSTAVGEMYGVGFCAISRCINIGQNLIDIGQYKQEKLGSRPHRAILVIENSVGADREAMALGRALMATDEAMSNQGFTRYAKMPVASIKGSANLLDLASLPDGFNELESVQLGMAVLALAFGVDVRQLAFAIGVAGQTKADAEVQHSKQRGKGPGAIIRKVTEQLEAKFLPPYLKLTFDWQDDEQDLQKAKIRRERSERRKSDLELGVTSVRIEREQMLEDDEITEAQFIQMELDDGRLPDGESVLSLFQSQDEQIQELLAIDPTIATEEEIQERIDELRGIIISTSIVSLKSKAVMALAALEKLQSSRQRLNAASEGSEEKENDLDEVFSKYKSVVNMSASELEAWGKTDCSKKASLDRSPIQRNLTLLRKPKSEWTSTDIRNANRTISFVSRMKGNLGGQRVIKDDNGKECGTKAHISLKNWAFDSKK